MVCALSYGSVKKMMLAVEAVDQLDLTLADRLRVAKGLDFHTLLDAVDRCDDRERLEAPLQKVGDLRIPGHIYWFVRGAWRKAAADDIHLSLQQQNVFCHFPGEYLRVVGLVV